MIRSRPTDQGGALVIVMAVVAALGIIGTISARQLMVHHNLATGALHKAVLRNLAEAGIAHALVQIKHGRQPQQQVLANEPVGQFVGHVEVASSRSGDGEWTLSSTAAIRTPANSRLCYLIRAKIKPRLPLATWQHIQILSWEESIIQ